MKKTIALIILSAIAGHSMIYADATHKTEVQSIMTEAYEAYGHNDYNKAVTLYESVLENGYHSAELYYNLGNTYYRTEQIGKAILNYERALKLRPHDKEAQENLALANSKTIDKIDQLPEFFVTRWIRAIENILSPKGWRVAILLLFALTGVSWSMFHTSQRYSNRKSYFLSGGICTILLVITVVFSISSQYHSTHSDKAIITSPMVTVKSSPEESGMEKFILHEGSKITIEDNVGDWYLVKIADGNKGWIHNTEIEII